MASEFSTRKEIIDRRLREAGWDVADRTQVIEEFAIPSFLLDAGQGTAPETHEPPAAYGPPGFSDYVLLGRNGKPLAAVEAKRSSKDAELGREQAKQYCHHIQSRCGCDLPFCFYTNGHDIHFWNLGEAPPQKVHGFPSRQDLERLLYIRTHKKPLTDELINTAIAGRDYQLQAIRSVLEGIERRWRLFLLVMATGTGKTRTCIALIDALMRAGWVQRVLFLVDRIALRQQALDAFKEHIPDEPRWPELGEKSITTDRRVYVATYPTMLNLVRATEDSLSPHFFDLVVIDESHRSIYNTYGEVLDYFSAIKIGLTATPRDDKRQRIAGSQLPEVVAQWNARDPQQPGDRKANHFFVPVQEICDRQYDLSFNRYAQVEHDETEYEDPKVILGKLKALEDRIQQGLAELEGTHT